LIGPGAEMDDLLFDDPMLMQQLGMMQPQQPMMGDQSTPGEREAPKSEGWSLALIVAGIILMISWIAVPVGGLGAWIYGPIEGFFAESVYSRFEAMMCGGLFVTIGVMVSFIIQNAQPKVNWVENDPGIPRTTYLKSIEDTGGSLLMKRRDGKILKVRKDIASRYKRHVHITANVLEIDSNDPSADIEFRTTSGSMSRGQIAAEEDLAHRQGYREQQLEEISQRYVAGQMDQIDGVDFQ
tara:strand:+ start:880 stop:1596 length:717 start_codon:yes stop_codon:yes gene_type:complete